MTDQEFATKKRGLQCKIGRGRAATRRAKTTAEKLAAMKQVQLLETAMIRPGRRVMSAADDFKAWRAQPEILAATWASNAADLQLAYDAGRASGNMVLQTALKDISEACNCCESRSDLAEMAAEALEAFAILTVGG